MMGVLAVGIVSLLLGMQIGQYFAGLVVYTVACVVGFAILFYVRYHGSMALQDEREAELERRASHITFQLFGYVGLFAFIALFLLDATDQYSLGSTVVTLLYAFSGVSLSWGAIYLALRYRP